MDFSKFKNYKDFKKQTNKDDEEAFNFLRNEMIRRGVLEQE